MSRVQIENFCFTILNDSRYSKLLPEWGRKKLLEIDIELTEDNIDTVLTQIYSKERRI